MNEKLNRIYFSADAGADPSGGGGEGGGDNTAEIKEFESLIEKGESSLSEQEKLRYEELKGKYDYQELDDEGNPITEEKRKQLEEVKKKVDSILSKPENQRSVEEVEFLKNNIQQDEVDVYEKVNEITGFDLSELDYGDINPKSPEGIAKREVFIRESAQQEYDDLLKANYPRAYSFFKFMAAGGKEEDFFKPENEDWNNISLSKSDSSTQESVIRKAYAIKGIKPEKIEILIKAAKDSGQLYDEAKSELEALQGEQKLKEQKQLQLEEQNKKEYQQRVGGFISSLNKELEKGINGNPIPIPERKKFYDFVTQNVSYLNGKFILNRELNDKELSKELAIEWFRYKGGNLEEFVNKKADSKNAAKIKQRIKIAITPKSGSSTGSKKYVPLGSV